MPPSDELPGVHEALASFFDAEWYLSRYPEIEAAGYEPLTHFVQYGAAAGRDPNSFFDSAWYLRHPDVTGQLPLPHYLQMGAAELHNPYPRFDATYYVDQHPEAWRRRTPTSLRRAGAGAHQGHVRRARRHRPLGREQPRRHAGLGEPASACR